MSRATATKPSTKRRRKRDDAPAIAAPEPANDNPPLDYAPPVATIVVDTTPPPILDYAAPEDVDPEPEDDEPYNRCPLCKSAIATFVFAVAFGLLLLAAIAIKAFVGVFI